MVDTALEIYNNPPAYASKTLADYHGLCLALLRIVAEKHHRINFYRDYVTEWVQAKGYQTKNGHWARDAERSLRNLGMAISPMDIQPGDMVFKYDTAALSQSTWAEWFPGVRYPDESNEGDRYVGHGAIFLGWVVFTKNGIVQRKRAVLENVNPEYRKHSLIMNNRNLCITDFSKFPSPTTVIRFNPALKV